jgi:SOS-response transcriptional repressor LexA
MRLRLSELLREKETREGRRITQDELARWLGVSQQQVSVLMRGGNKQVSYRLLDRLSRYFGVPISQLFEGSPVAEARIPGVEIDANSIVLLPVLGRVNAGPLDEEHQEILEWYPWPTSLGARPGCFALVVSGDSMVDAHILPGSKVILDPNLEPRSGDIVAVLLNGESGLKRIFIDDGGAAVLLSENREQNYPPVFVRKGRDEMHIQGVVVNIILTPEPRRFYQR